jgi:hypothetical protein
MTFRLQRPVPVTSAFGPHAPSSSRQPTVFAPARVSIGHEAGFLVLGIDGRQNGAVGFSRSRTPNPGRESGTRPAPCQGHAPKAPFRSYSLKCNCSRAPWANEGSVLAGETWSQTQERFAWPSFGSARTSRRLFLRPHSLVADQWIGPGDRMRTTEWTRSQWKNQQILFVRRSTSPSAHSQ